MKTRTGELTIKCLEYTHLVKALRPLPDSREGLSRRVHRQRGVYRAGADEEALRHGGLWMQCAADNDCGVQVAIGGNNAACIRPDKPLQHPPSRQVAHREQRPEPLLLRG